MVLALCDPRGGDQKRVWKNIYGFDMTCMLEGVYDEGIVEAITADTVLTRAQLLKWVLHFRSQEHSDHESLCTAFRT